MKNNNKSNKGLIIALAVGIPVFFLIMLYIFFLNFLNNFTCAGYANNEEDKMFKYFIEKYDIKDIKNIKILDGKYFSLYYDDLYANIEYNNKKIRIKYVTNTGNYCDDYQTDKFSDDISTYFKKKFNFISTVLSGECFTEKYDGKNIEEFLKKENVDLDIHIQSNSQEEAKEFYINNAYKIVDYMEKLNKQINNKGHTIDYKIEFKKDLKDFDNLLFFSANLDTVNAYYEVENEVIDENGNSEKVKKYEYLVRCKREELVHGMCMNNDN